jgi:hypothetical protein
MAIRKPVNRKMSPPPVPLEERNGEVVGFPFFNLDAPEGFYKIDSFKSYMAGAAPLDFRNEIVPPYQEIRMFVEHAAGWASLRASNETHSVDAHKFAGAAIANLEKIQHITKRLLKASSEHFEDLFRSGTELTESAAKIQQEESFLLQKARLDALAQNRPYVAPPPSDKIVSVRNMYAGLKDFEAKIEAFLRDRKLKKRPHIPSRSDPLARVFIEMMAKFWRDRTSKARGDQAAFIRFLAAAWEDLHFPEPIDRKGKPKPLLDWFNERVPKQLVHIKLTSPGI